MDDKCIVSLGVGHDFERGIDRLQNLIEHNVKIPFFGYKQYPALSPTHEISPFAFKFYCIQECLQKGFTNILWLDSSVIIKNNLQSVFNTMKNIGYFFVANSHSAGQYCHDRALETLQISREESFQYHSLQGTNFGLNFNFDICKNFLHKMLELSNDGVTFPGPHNNTNNLASKDTRVSGHRHEQTAMSIIAIKMGMTTWARNETSWFEHDRKYVKSVISTMPDIDMSL